MNKKIDSLDENEISSKGFVIDSLEAAIWCLLKSHTYSETVLRAVNLGGDTDTISAIAGGLAGIYYGISTFPEQWLAELRKSELIEVICNSLYFQCYSNATFT